MSRKSLSLSLPLYWQFFQLKLKRERKSVWKVHLWMSRWRKKDAEMENERKRKSFCLCRYFMVLLCVFLVSFVGKFKEQATSNSAWLPVLNSKVPDPRPGTCVNDTASLPDSVLNFIRSHPLMDKAVNHEHNNPVFYKRDLVFTKLVVDK